MTNKKLLMLAAAGLLTPAALAGSASAEVTTTKVLAAPKLDKAPVNAQGKLRRTNEEQTMEMPSVVMLGAKKDHGLYLAMTTEIADAAGQPVGAPNRTQCSLTPFKLTQTPTGAVTVDTVAPGSTKFVTNNLQTNDYRNCNQPTGFALTQDIGCFEYNVQLNNSNDTKKYLQCFKADGTRVLGQTQIFAKNNDDAAQNASGKGSVVTQIVNNKAQVCGWRGANGNGRDDGWVHCYSLTIGADNVTFQQGFDVSVAPREERTRGNVSISAKDPNTLIATWSEGDTQPTRDGTWIAAIDVTPGKYSGANQQRSILWKQMIRGRVDAEVAGQNLRTYSMRAAHERILEEDPATGELVPGDNILFYANDLRGNNNTNYKGGTVHRLTMGVIKATKEGMSFVKPLEDTNQLIKGIGGTHIHMIGAVFGEKGKLTPGAMFINGSHTGGRFNSEGRAMGWDTASNKFTDLGKVSAGPFDRHMYSNYLGNNPGNQGRNFASHELIKNPFVGMNGNTDEHLVIFASTAKAPEDTDAAIKTSGFLTVIPVTSSPAAAPPPNPNQTPDPQDPADPQDPTDPGSGSSDTTLGGCSTTGSTGGVLTFLLIGLAAFLRRRR